MANYTISLPEDTSGYIVKLEDKQEGKMVELNANEVYSFYAKSGNLNGRFVLHFLK